MRPIHITFPFLLAGFAAMSVAQQSQTLIRQHVGTRTDEFRGESVLGMDDLNGDGVADYLVGGSRFQTTLGAVGRVAAFSGATGAELYSAVGPARDMRLGFSLARIRDQNGDGVADWVAGAPFDDARGTDAGRVMCFSGRTGVLLWQAFGTGPNQLFGWSMATFGLFGSTGEALAVGAPGNGAAMSRMSMLRTTNGTAFASAEAPARHRFGTSMASDGALLAVGAPGSGPNAEGSVRFFRHQFSLVEFDPYLSFDPGAAIGASITRFVAPGGVNFAIGGAGTASIPGRVDLISASTAAVFRVRSLLGVRAGDGFGFSIASGADADGDGVADLLVGAPEDSQRGPRAGAAYFYSGRTLARTFTLPGFSGSTYGWAVGMLDDVSGDGLAEFAIGLPLANSTSFTRAGRLDIHSVDLAGRTETYGTRCTNAGFLADIARLRPGGSLLLSATGLAPGGATGVWVIGTEASSVSLAGIGMTGCFLNVVPLVTETLQTPTSVAMLSLPIPMDPRLARATFRAQFAVLAPGANPAGVVSSIGLELTLGNR